MKIGNTSRSSGKEKPTIKGGQRYETDRTKLEVVHKDEVMEIRLVLDDELINTLKQRLNTKNATDVIRESISLLDWATEEAENNRAILSIGEDGEDPKRIEAPALRTARRRARREVQQPA